MPHSTEYPLRFLAVSRSYLLSQHPPGSYQQRL